MKYLLEKDRSKRLLFYQKEWVWVFYRSLLKNQCLENSVRILLYEQILQLSKNSSKFRVKNRCFFTGRSKSVYRKFRMSRITFREFANLGILSGISKSSW